MNDICIFYSNVYLITICTKFLFIIMPLPSTIFNVIFLFLLCIIECLYIDSRATETSLLSHSCPVFCKHVLEYLINKVFKSNQMEQFILGGKYLLYPHTINASVFTISFNQVSQNRCLRVHYFQSAFLRLFLYLRRNKLRYTTVIHNFKNIVDLPEWLVVDTIPNLL